jgi:hypothetical protein
MPDLAGFDVVGEIHLETISDLLNLVPLTNPVDGKSIYLLGGPFSTDVNVDLGPVGTLTFRLMLEAELEPMQHRPLTRIGIAFQGGSSLGSERGLGHVSGQLSVDVPMNFAPLLPGGRPLVPTFQFAFVAPNVVLDAQTRSLADSSLGSGGADRLINGLRSALAKLLASLGTVSLPIMGFTIVPSVDSSDPLQLSAPPSIAWIDAKTLGVFGYYRAAATGGDVSRKTTSDLGQPHEEFFYDRPGLFPTVAGRRIAILFSPDAFVRVIGCPAVRTSVVRQLVFNREHASWVDWVRRNDGDRISQDINAQHLIAYYLDEMQNHPDESTQQHYDKAKERVQKDIDTAIDGEASGQEDAWLNSAAPAGPETDPGQEAIESAVPLPCGQGAVEITRRSVEHAQSDLVPMLRRLEVKLGNGAIPATFHADGLLEVITGDISFTGDGEIDVTITVDDFGHIISSYKVQTPNIDVSASGFTGSVLGFLRSIFSEEAWQALLVLLSLIVQQKINDAMAKQFPQTIAVNLPQQLFPTRMAEVKIDPTGLFVAALVCREQRWNEFNPALIVTATLDSRTRDDEPEVDGSIHFNATAWGCPEAKFWTKRTFWNETYTVRARLRDAPLPVTVTGWQAQLGNFSWNSIAGSAVLDARPMWSSRPVAVRGGRLTLSGQVEHLDTLMSPYLHGPLTPADVPIDVSGDTNSGWQVALRGADGNYYLRFAVDVVDGDGKQWHGETFIVHEGDHLQMQPEYDQYKADCDAKTAEAIHRRITSAARVVGVGRVRPGQPVTSELALQATTIRTLIAADANSAFRQLAAAGARYGPTLYRQIGHIQPLELGEARTAE